MNGERILLADDQRVTLDALKAYLEAYGGESGHEIVGYAPSVSEVERLMKEGLRPSVALVDGKFPNHGDGKIAAGIIKKESPETIVVEFSTSESSYGDIQWSKNLSGPELVKALTDLQH